MKQRFLIVCVLVLCGCVVSHATTVNAPIQAVYNFTTDCGRIIHDSGTYGIDLYVSDPHKASCVAGAGLELFDHDSRVVPYKIKSFDRMLDSIRESNAFTIMVEAMPYNPNELGNSLIPTRLLSISSDVVCPDDMNFLIGQFGCNLTVRLRTDATKDCKSASITVPNVMCNGLTHVAIVRERQYSIVYVNGNQMTLVSCDGTLGNWANYPLVLGNELTGGRMRQWFGVVAKVFISAEAMNAKEIVLHSRESRVHSAKLARLIEEHRQKQIDEQKERLAGNQLRDVTRFIPSRRSLDDNISPPVLSVAVIIFVSFSVIIAIMVIRYKIPHGRKKVTSTTTESDVTSTSNKKRMQVNSRINLDVKYPEK